MPYCNDARILLFLLAILFNQSCHSYRNSDVETAKSVRPGTQEKMPFQKEIESLFSKEGLVLENYEHVYSKKITSDSDKSNWRYYIALNLRQNKIASKKASDPPFVDLIVVPNHPIFLIKDTSHISIDLRKKIILDKLISDLNKKKSDIVDGTRVWYR